MFGVYSNVGKHSLPFKLKMKHGSTTFQNFHTFLNLLLTGNRTIKPTPTHLKRNASIFDSFFLTAYMFRGLMVK